MESKKQKNTRTIFEPSLKAVMIFGMEKPWYKELLSFLIVPFLATLACVIIPIFHCDQGLSFMAIVPLNAAFGYGHILSPRKIYYERVWKGVMEYHEYILACTKRTLLFAFLSAQAVWVSNFFLKGYFYELGMFFEMAIVGLATGVCLCSLVLYLEDLSKLRKAGHKQLKAKVWKMIGWIFPITALFILWAVLRGVSMVNLLAGRT